MFTQFVVDFETNKFDELSKSVQFDTKENKSGRKCVTLVDDKNSLIPIVRTTTIYNKAAQRFVPIHYDIIENIKKVSNNHNLQFNNAMLEIYNSNYRHMKYHSDQSLDLANDSYICLFSCYDSASPSHKRKLKIKEKQIIEKKIITSEIILEHNSVVLFSVDTNSKWLHKIGLENTKSNDQPFADKSQPFADKGQWLGITFRLSKTFIKFIDNVPYLNTKILKMANEEEKKELMKCKSLENCNVGYKYPEINYSISPSDLLVPVIE